MGSWDSHTRTALARWASLLRSEDYRVATSLFIGNNTFNSLYNYQENGINNLQTSKKNHRKGNLEVWKCLI